MWKMIFKICITSQRFETPWLTLLVPSNGHAIAYTTIYRCLALKGLKKNGFYDGVCKPVCLSSSSSFLSQSSSASTKTSERVIKLKWNLKHFLRVQKNEFVNKPYLTKIVKIRAFLCSGKKNLKWNHTRRTISRIWIKFPFTLSQMRML